MCAIVFFFIFFEPSLLSKLTSAVSCTTIGSKKYIQSDLNSACYTYTHIFYSLLFILPMILLVLIIIPLIALRYLFQNKNNLNK